MKLFQECQKNFAILGINSKQETSFNERLIITYLINKLGLTSCIAFIFLEASTFQEYSNNAYVTTSLAVSITVLTNIVFQKAALFKLIENTEELFEESLYILHEFIFSIFEVNVGDVLTTIAFSRD